MQRWTQRTIGLVALLIACVGCGVVNHLVGQPEGRPTLGVTLQYLVAMASFGDDPSADPNAPPDPNTPATPADPAEPSVPQPDPLSIADLAGVWVEHDGMAAVHIDSAGMVYQVDIADEVWTEYVGIPPLVRTVYNAGQATITDDQTVELNLAVSLPSLTASVNATGQISRDRNAVLLAPCDIKTSVGSYPQGDWYWFRWDMQTDAPATTTEGN